LLLLPLLLLLLLQLSLQQQLLLLEGLLGHASQVVVVKVLPVLWQLRLWHHPLQQLRVHLHLDVRWMLHWPCNCCCCCCWHV
jgi:hypothetical protein